MYAEINAHDLRRCPLPPLQEVEKDDAEDAWDVARDHSALGHQHRAGETRTVAATPERIRRTC